MVDLLSISSLGFHIGYAVLSAVARTFASARLSC